MQPVFDLNQVLPHLHDQAAEVTGLSFQDSYRDHGMSRTEWRAMANLGRAGPLIALGQGK